MLRFSFVFILFLVIWPAYAQDDEEAVVIPEPVTMIETGSADISNILLIGSATENGSNNPGLTDSLMVVSVNHDSGHVGILSLPRDLYVFVPGYEMRKLNQAYFLAETQNQDGIDLLEQVIAYNFGINIDYYARVDFSSFGDVIDSMGGIDIAIDCAIEDWRLKEPDLDKHDEDNWEMVTMWAGLYHFDGDTALWYVRSRRTSSDLDRGRRQQDVMRALWRQIRNEGIIENFSQLWEQFTAIVETDMTIVDAARFLPIVADLDPAAVDYFTMRLNYELTRGYTPDEGRFVFYPVPDAMETLITELLSPVATRNLSRALPTVAIYNASGTIGLAYVAAQRLEREGFLTTIINEPTTPRDYNHLVDQTGLDKNNPATRIQSVLRITDEGVETRPDPARDYDYILYIGSQYQLMSCTFPVQAPKAEAEE